MSLSISKPINADLALTVGQNFLSNSVSPNPFAQGLSLELIYTSKSNATSNTSKIALPNYFYVFKVCFKFWDLEILLFCYNIYFFCYARNSF